MRAMRRMWARIIRDRYGCSDPRAQRFRFHAQTSGASLTAQQPHNNIVRGAVEAMAAVLGGAQSLHISCYDETYGLPTDDAIRVSLATQNILAHEAGLVATVDPLGGSYALEDLTDAIETEAARTIAQIDGMGGMLSAIENGWVQRQIHRSAYRTQREIESGERRVVGVNCHEEAEDQRPAAAFRVDLGVEAAQREAVARVRAERSAAEVEKALDHVRRAAEGRDNLLPPLIAALRTRATIGEVSDALRAVFGVYREAPML
jgi:methylmalonyl-CoA mutase N-terminal domain/subunit